MDAELAARLAELDADGLADDTIVVYFSDNGGVLPWSKRFANDRGLRVPLIVRVPPKWSHLAPPPGSVVTTPINFASLTFFQAILIDAAQQQHQRIPSATLQQVAQSLAAAMQPLVNVTPAANLGFLGQLAQSEVIVLQSVIATEKPKHNDDHGGWPPFSWQCWSWWWPGLWRRRSW